MGLDLVVEGCAKPGLETEWRRMLERAFADEQLTETEIARFAEISIPAYERLGAPRVGYDDAASKWIIEARKARTPEDVAAVLKEFHGYYAVRLVTCDGVPLYSHAGLYEGVDETSFRGAFLESCIDVLPKELIVQAWGHKLPEAAVTYGQALLAAAETASTGKALAPKRGFFARLGLAKKAPAPMALGEQFDIVRAAGRWHIFWGERGHAIRAWF